MAPRTLSRRGFLAGLAAPPPSAWFEQIPPARSGIHWKHDNAMSAKPYLPESLGPGVAFLDYDNDGKLDVLIGDNGAAPVLLKNTVAASNNWLGIKLRGIKANRDGAGAMITQSAGGTKRQRLKRAGGSFLSSHDPREILGLGNAGAVDWIEVRWPAPSTRLERFKPPAVNRYITLEEGAGSV